MWLRNSTSDRCVYHHGFLMYDRQAPGNDGRAACAIANVLWQAYERGRVDLFQRKMKRFPGCLYIAVKRFARPGKPTHAPALYFNWT